MVETFPNLVKEINLRIQVVQQSTNRINTKQNRKHPYTYHGQTGETYNKEKIQKAAREKWDKNLNYQSYLIRNLRGEKTGR